MNMNKRTQITLTELEIRTLLLGLASYSHELSKEVQEHEARTGTPSTYARNEHAETRALIDRLRAA
jgi:hypothetical protein